MKVGYESGIGAWFDKLEFKEACGTGSYPNKNKEYCTQLLEAIKKNKIKSVVDYGCGNLETYKGNIDWKKENIAYTGYDANIQCVDTLKEKYPQYDFEYSKLNQVPDKNADALIIKDVLIHWFDKDIKSFFDNVFDKYNYIIYMHSTKNQGYIDDKNKREMYKISDPSQRKGMKLILNTLPDCPDGWCYWDEGCYGYKAVPSELIPNEKIIYKNNIMGDSMKTFIVFKG